MTETPTLDMDTLEADVSRQLERTRRIPTEPLVSLKADTVRALIAAAKERDELRAELQARTEERDHARASADIHARQLLVAEAEISRLEAALEDAKEALRD